MGVRIYLRKFYVFDVISELVSCRDNKERYTYILSEIIYRLKNEELIVSVKDFKLICAVYYTYLNLYCLNTIKRDTFQRITLKKVIPDKKWGKVDDKFFNDVLELVLKIKSEPTLH